MAHLTFDCRIVLPNFINNVTYFFSWKQQYIELTKYVKSLSYVFSNNFQGEKSNPGDNPQILVVISISFSV